MSIWITMGQTHDRDRRDSLFCGTSEATCLPPRDGAADLTVS